MSVPSLALASSVGNAPLWRREPYRVLFPLGVLLAWAGVLHWLLFALGISEEYRSIFHSMAQIQGFIACFAVGFLFTMIPRRTGTAAPAPWQMAVAIGAPVATTVLAWFEQFAAAQISWLLLLAIVMSFALRRFRPGDIPDSFVWVIAAILFGIGGAILAGWGAANDAMWLHDVGRGLVLQGMMTALVIGVGGFLLPAITRGEPPARPLPARKVQHVLAALIFAASFFLEPESLRLGFGLRAAVVALALIPPTRLWRPPSMQGLHRRMVWVAGWLLPIGYAFVAALPEYRRVGLHIVFIGCFALMVFAVSVHVILSHGGATDLLEKSPWQLKAISLLLGIALVFRMLVDFAPDRLRLWLGIAAAAFLTSTLVWAHYTLRHVRSAFA
jgi:uncharacterized protein involved in response to NO